MTLETIPDSLSHPVRVRGLKPGPFLAPLIRTPVAPRAGAWIETMVPSSSSHQVVVAPRAGAWIETTGYYEDEIEDKVAPRAGAWIETQVK